MKWTLEKRKITELREFARNPRRLNKHDAKHLQESLEKFGQCEPLVINSDDTVIGGHQRLRTLKKLKYKEVDVYVPDSPLSEKEVEELNIRLNRNNGEWDYDMLANAWESDDLFDWGFLEEEFGMGTEDKAEKKKKFVISLEFSDKDEMLECMNKCEELAQSSGAKLKMKG
jgi:hypothetical protein